MFVSDIFALRFSTRPPNCTEISPTTCAVLFDRWSCLKWHKKALRLPSADICTIWGSFYSSSCSSSGWSLEIVDGARKELKYWSSDWKYRWDLVHGMDLDLNLVHDIDLDLVHDKEENFKDFFQRNDADIVGVRRGCKFSAWTEVVFKHFLFWKSHILDSHETGYLVGLRRYLEGRQPNTTLKSQYLNRKYQVGFRGERFDLTAKESER